MLAKNLWRALSLLRGEIAYCHLLADENTHQPGPRNALKICANTCFTDLYVAVASAVRSSRKGGAGEIESVTVCVLAASTHFLLCR
jgi:hypothetical protein